MKETRLLRILRLLRLLASTYRTSLLSCHAVDSIDAMDAIRRNETSLRNRECQGGQPDFSRRAGRSQKDRHGLIWAGVDAQALIICLVPRNLKGEAVTRLQGEGLDDLDERFVV